MIMVKELINNNKQMLKDNMMWDNYDLNNIELPVVDAVKEHALMVLSKTYGRFQIDPDDLDMFSSDVFIYFPSLLQQLSISKVMIGESVVPIDQLKETTTRTEKSSRNVEGKNDLMLGSINTQVNDLDTETATTGTVKDTGTSSNIGNQSNVNTQTTTITNNSDIKPTGSRNVNLNYDMPEQAITAGTNQFPIDDNGAPILNKAMVQQATESYNSSRNILNEETSDQVSNSNDNQNSNSSTTNNLTNTQDIKVSNSGTNTSTTTNSGTDTSLNEGKEDYENTITETIDREVTNAQYSYEISNFLTSVQSINAFRNWVNRFAWVCGIL